MNRTFLKNWIQNLFSKNVPYNFKLPSIAWVPYNENSPPPFLPLASSRSIHSGGFFALPIHSLKSNLHLSLSRKTSALHEPAFGSSHQCGVLLARSTREPHRWRPRAVPQQRCDSSDWHGVTVSLFFYLLALLSLNAPFSRSGRRASPPPHSHPLPVRVAHVWRQRAEPGPLLRWEPQQDPAGLRPGVPQCQARRANKSTDVTLDSSASANDHHS